MMPLHAQDPTSPSSPLRKKLDDLETKNLAFSIFPSYIATQFPAYRFSPHNQAISAVLSKVESGDINRLMIFMPPRHGKTMQVSEFFPSWYLGRNPENVKKLVELAELLSIPVIEWPRTRMNFPTENPLHLGFDPHPFICEADVILIIDLKRRNSFAMDK